MSVQTSYATIDTFSSRFGISRSQIYVLIGDGTLRAVKVGRRTLVDVSAATEWLNSLPRAPIGQPYRDAA